jgi:hypothetical protein
MFGFAAALGLDYTLTRNFFVRGEVEYLQFSTPSYHAQYGKRARGRQIEILVFLALTLGSLSRSFRGAAKRRARNP